MSTAVSSESRKVLLGSPIIRAGNMAMGLVRMRMTLELILTQKRLPAAGSVFFQ